MSYVLNISSENDVDKARLWYALPRRGLGIDFVLSVDDTLTHILNQPMAYAIIHNEYRRALVRRFPYGVFFSVAENAIKLVTVFHTRRLPEIWRKRREGN